MSNMDQAHNASAKCTYITHNGHHCPNYSRTIYEGKHVCNVHLNTIKANDNCPICLSMMGNPALRMRVKCGHYFHTACLGMCMEIKCPICRADLAPRDISKAFTPTKVTPLFDKVFTFSAKKQHIIFETLGQLVDNVTEMSEADMDIFRAYNSSFFINLKKIQDANDCFVVDDEPAAVMFDWMNVTSMGVSHVASYGTYEGFYLRRAHNEVNAVSRDPGGSVAPYYVPYIQNVPYAPPSSPVLGNAVVDVVAVEPVNVIEAVQVAQDEPQVFDSPASPPYTPMERSYSPQLPWYYH
jgi:hypothetical protein